MTTTTTRATSVELVEQLSGRIFTACLGAVELFTVHLGVQLGLYRALADGGPQTCSGLAARTALTPRYVREWLQGQVISGFLSIDGDDVDTATFALAPGVHETLIDETSPAYVGALPGLLPPIGRVTDDLLDAFRTGEGLPYEQYEAAATQEALNRPAYEHCLVSEWLPQIPDVLARLQDTADPARVADIACGAGWSSIVLAEAFPHISVDGFDSDEDSIARARRNAAERNVSATVRFEVADITAAPPAGRYDVGFIFEAVHDLSRPVEALANCRRMLKPHAPLIVMDERVAEQLTAPGDEVERFMAAASVVWCTPQGHGPESQVVGAVLRPDVLADLARRAGFATVDILPIEHPFWRFYRLGS